MGTFKPQHPEKYKGKLLKIIYRSSWELRLMLWLDKHPDILTWSSESVVVLYHYPPGHMRRYFPDFLVTRTGKDGIVETVMVEVKPEIQTLPPKPPRDGRGKSRYLNEMVTFTKNQAKWQAAEAYCSKRGWRFMLMTERNLGLK